MKDSVKLKDSVKDSRFSRVGSKKVDIQGTNQERRKTVKKSEFSDLEKRKECSLRGESLPKFSSYNWTSTERQTKTESRRKTTLAKTERIEVQNNSEFETSCS